VQCLSGLREQFGDRLKTIRSARKMSQEDFAELLGISVDFLSLIERGINAPSFENLEAFSARLGVPVHELFLFEAPTTFRSDKQQ
jgi:transcriptional regulator with XRE-family HTH domain